LNADVWWYARHQGPCVGTIGTGSGGGHPIPREVNPRMPETPAEGIRRRGTASRGSLLAADYWRRTYRSADEGYLAGMGIQELVTRARGQGPQ